LDNVLGGLQEQAIDVHSLLEECIAQHDDSDKTIRLNKMPSADDSNLNEVELFETYFVQTLVFSFQCNFVD